MEGVRVLAESEDLGVTSCIELVFFIVTVGILMVLIVIIGEKLITSPGIIVITFLIFACVIILGYFTFDFKNQYDVTIDKNVSYIEFTQKYKIVKQKGQIYTVIDKED